MTGFPEIVSSPVDPRAYPDGIAYQDGQYMRMADAKISVLDYGFLHSDATYDTVHVWDGAFFRLDLHLARFFRGIQKLHMTVAYDEAAVAQILSNCVALSGHRRAYVQMICTRGTAPDFSRDPRNAQNRFMAFAIGFGSVASPEQLARGLHLSISDRVRIPPASLDPAIKNYHWLDLVQALYDGYAKGAETALVLDTDGNVAEGPGFNVFAVTNGRLATPAAGVLPGITRQTVFDLAAMLELKVEARAVTPSELEAADEVFIASTAGGIMPVTRLDGQPIGTGKPGAVTSTLREKYWAMHRDPMWIRPVIYP